jgi:ABC-type phosphate transport system auxiliary subunit
VKQKRSPAVWLLGGVVVVAVILVLVLVLLAL